MEEFENQGLGLIFGLWVAPGMNPLVLGSISKKWISLKSPIHVEVVCTPAVLEFFKQKISQACQRNLDVHILERRA